jgi:hypothetical protein
MKAKRSSWIVPLVLLGSLVMIISSCTKDDSTSSKISDDNFYKQVGYAMVMCYVDIYNQNLAGKPVGGQNMTKDGPMGGTVNITGTTGYASNNGITTTDLEFSMNSVKYTTNVSGFETEITLTGTTTYTGSFSNTYTSVNHQSGNLYILGSVTHNTVVRKIDMTGAVSINRSTSKISANIFGNSVSW